MPIHTLSLVSVPFDALTASIIAKPKASCDGAHAASAARWSLISVGFSNVSDLRGFSVMWPQRLTWHRSRSLAMGSLRETGHTPLV